MPIGQTCGSQRQLVNDWFSPFLTWEAETEQRSSGLGAVNLTLISQALREYLIRQWLSTEVTREIFLLANVIDSTSFSLTEPC